jgi:hypothetical protein
MKLKTAVSLSEYMDVSQRRTSALKPAWIAAHYTALGTSVDVLLKKWYAGTPTESILRTAQPTRTFQLCVLSVHPFLHGKFGIPSQLYMNDF